MKCRSQISLGSSLGLWRCRHEGGHPGYHELEVGKYMLMWRGALAHLEEGSLREVLYTGTGDLLRPEFCEPGTYGSVSLSSDRHDWVLMETTGVRSPLASLYRMSMSWYCRRCRRVDETTVGDYWPYLEEAKLPGTAPDTEA